MLIDVIEVTAYVITVPILAFAFFAAFGCGLENRETNKIQNEDEWPEF